MACPQIGSEEIGAVIEVLESGNLAHGKVVEQFEANFAEYIGVRYAVAVSSGTTALHLALLSAGMGKGDVVITTPFSFSATSNVILMCGATPFYIDIDPVTFNIDLFSFEKQLEDSGIRSGLLSGSIKGALLPVHLYGNPCAMDVMMDLSIKYNLNLIEDCCQAAGASYYGVKVGSFGTGCFSFYPTKNMCCGEGGMITTRNIRVADLCRKLRNHGQIEKYNTGILGFNYRMTNIEAAIGIEQLKKLDILNEKRALLATVYDANLSDVKGIIIPTTPSKFHNHVYNQYTIQVTKDYPVTRDILRHILYDEGINSEVYYPIPIPSQALYTTNGEYYKYCPNATVASHQVLSLPIHPGVSVEEVKYISDIIQNVQNVC